MSLGRRAFFEESLVPSGLLTLRPSGIKHMIQAQEAHQEDLTRVHLEEGATMADTYIELRVASPSSEYSHEFIQAMLNAMAVSYYKYGKVRQAYPHKVDALKSLRDRLSLYLDTGNTEYLVDAANFAMIEFMCPHLANAAYTPTDDSGSPGRRSAFTGKSTKARNEEIGSEAEGTL